MSDSSQNNRKPRRWLRWLRRLVVLAGMLFIIVAVLLFYLYYNLTSVVVWFANRSHPRLILDLGHAGFTGNSQIEFHNLSLKLDKENEQVILIEKAVVRFNWNDLRNHRIASILVDKPQLIASDHLLDHTPEESPAAKKIDLVSSSGLWLVDEFKVTGGKGEVNLSNCPAIRFDFTSDMRAVYLSAETKFSTETQALDIKNMEFFDKAAKARSLGGIKSATARFTLDHIAQGRLDELSIRSPSLTLTPAFLAAFGGSVSAQAPPVVSAAGATVSPATPFVIGKLHVADGECFMKEFGVQIPETSCKFSVDEEDLQLASRAGELLEKLHKLQLWDVRTAASFAPAEPFLWVGSIQVDFTSGGLFDRKEIGGLTITSMDFQMGQKFRSLMEATAQQSATNAPTTAAPVTAVESTPWKVANFRIYNGRASLTDLGSELPNINFKLDTELKNVALSGDIRHASKEIEEVTISNLVVPSPYDPFTPVLNFKKIHLRFSLAQILDQEIDQVVLEGPTIFVGEQLFWYGDELKRRQVAAAGPAAQAPQSGAINATTEGSWRINKFIVDGGKLTISNAGQAGVTMPFEFNSEADNLHFNNLSDLQLKVKLKVVEADYYFPSYQLEFKQFRGTLDFGVPPGTGARDLEQTLYANGAKWKQFNAHQLWLSVTYDSQGIYGKFGGEAYKGYVTGGFQFYMLQDTPWAGWVSGTGIDLKQITDILAPQNFQLSGPADCNIEMQGLNHEIVRVAGTFKAKSAGKLKIGKFNELIANLPKTWSSLKQGTTRIALETLRDFDYTTGNGDFWYAGEKGHLALKVRGPHGSRNFDISLHGD